MTEPQLPHTVRELADDADLLPLWEAVHERLCAGTKPARIATITVSNMPAGGVAVLRNWLDTSTRRRRGNSAVSTAGNQTQVPLRELLDLFGLDPEHLPVIATLAVGRPLVNRALARAASATVREQLWAQVESDLGAVPRLARRICASGVAESDIEAIALQCQRLKAALITIDILRGSVAAPLTLAKLAHDCAGDPHAFDLDTLTGRRLVEAVAELLDEPEPTRPDAVRALLARVGILADRLSSSVLVLNLQASGNGIVDQRLRLGGGPLPLTLYDLTVHPPDLETTPLLVVENPSVLEAALAIGFTEPLACTSGHLRAVDHAFLQRALDCDVPLSYSGDLDRDGLIIAGQIRDLYGARIVGMNEEVVRQARSQPSTVPLSALPPTLPAELAGALMESGRAIFQENNVVLKTLFA
ncbi:TIGR02679 domain-containing protein [Nocardia acidivorans]|uniref:TIGR02679 domain-containing protein n=1 Tax=Nocardia acidivorans TaxID=404580 RepID=UPI000A3F7750|nr:TIGR02679 domain-containing protein [Nocardia acidivorans]